MKILRVVAILLLASFARAADVQIASLFSDHMVLQQGMPVPVWGWADAGTKVTVRFAGQTASAVAGEDGKWKLNLPALQANAKPADLVIDSGGNSKAIKDVLVGEVWLFSGQSNMALRLKNSLDAEKVAAAANDPLLRYINVNDRPAERPADMLTGEQWTAIDPKSAPDCSAVAYYTAARLRKDLNVPVGIVLCSWGGSSVCTWMSPASMRSPELRTLVPENLLGWRNNVQPYLLYNGMLHPLAPYAVKGAIWYQGETEGTEYQGAYRNAYLYRLLLPAMVADWRRLWGRDDLPFYFVQLPNLKTPRLHWPELRESQAVAATKIPQPSGMIPSIDIGDDGNLHPKNKRVFGERIADLILDQQYGKKSWAGVPSFELQKIEGSAIRLKFRDVGKGLKTTDGKPVRAFAIAGKDGKYHDADARIDGADSVVVRSDTVASPISVRYAWAQAPGVNLANESGLPVIPFRTDSLPVTGSQMTWEKLPSKKDLAVTTSGAELAKSVESADWIATSSDSELAKLLANKQMITVSPRTCELRFLDKPQRNMTDSPSILWTTNPGGAAKAIDAGKGMTAEVLIQSTVVADPLRGFDLEVGLKQEKGKLLRYSITIQPMHLNAFARNEMHMIRSDLDNVRERLAYRLAIRPDGVAQLYMGEEKIGLLAGQEVDGDESYVRIGKSYTEGEYIVTLIHAAFDAGGAFAP